MGLAVEVEVVEADNVAEVHPPGLHEVEAEVVAVEVEEDQEVLKINVVRIVHRRIIRIVVMTEMINLHKTEIRRREQKEHSPRLDHLQTHPGDRLQDHALTRTLLLRAAQYLLDPQRKVRQMLQRREIERWKARLLLRRAVTKV